MRARFSSAALSDTFEREPIDAYIFLPSRENTIQRVQCPPPRSNPPGREMFRQFLGWSTRLEIAIAIWKSNHTVSIRDVQKLRSIVGWIKGDPERFFKSCSTKVSVTSDLPSLFVSRSTFI